LHIVFWLENLRGRDHLEEIGVDGKIILECSLGKWDGRMWSGYRWLSIGIRGALVYMAMNLQIP